MIAVAGTATLGIVCGAYRILRTGQLDQLGVWLFLALFSMSVVHPNGILNWHGFSINFHIILFGYGFGPNFVGLLLAWWYRVVCQKTGREIAQGSVHGTNCPQGADSKAVVST